MTPEEAYNFLIKDLENPENIQYVTHCRFVGNLAGKIASEIPGADADFAKCLGYLHDIGRKIEPTNHTYAGYRYLLENGCEKYAFICLTHSYLNNEIDCTAGRTLPKTNEGYEFIKEFVENHENTIYDKIIQVCDLLCLHSGGTTIEERLSDIESRKGTHPGSAHHRETALKQKAELENIIGHSIYDFYPL